MNLQIHFGRLQYEKLRDKQVRLSKINKLYSQDPISIDSITRQLTQKVLNQTKTQNLQTMNKLSRPNYGLEEQIMQTIFRLRDKKSSQIFRQPVDASLVQGYYEKIKNPMDLTTINNKLKEGKYQYAKEVYDDLQLMIENCKTFNMFQTAILKKAEQFYECIKTQWNNFEKEIKKKDISIDKKIQINEEIQKRLIAIEQKRKKKKVPILQTTLENQKKNILPEYSILPPLPAYLFEDRNQIKEELPEQLAYKKQDYANLTQDDKTQKLNLILNHEEVEKQFDLICSKKLNKYRKILYKKIMWIEQKIIQRCLEKKKFRKMLLPQYLSKFIEKGQIAKQLNIRKIQMYVKQVTYWVEEYSQILSYYMKEKFVDTCKAIRKCLLRVLRYKKIPKTTKISLQLGIDAAQNDQIEKQQTESKILQGDKTLSMSVIGDEESKRYQSKMKEFRRMLYKDRSQSTKRDTKITIKNENGEFSIVDWNSQATEKRKVNRSGFGEGIKSLENRQYDEEKRKKEERKDELKKDDDFITQCRARLSRDVLQQSIETFEIMWDVIQQRKYSQLQKRDFSFEGFSVKPKPEIKVNIHQNIFKIPTRG